MQAQATQLVQGVDVLSQWPEQPLEGDTFVYTGRAWWGDEFGTETFVSLPVCVTECVPESTYGGGFYAKAVGDMAADDEEIFVAIEEFRTRLEHVRATR